MRIWDLPVSCLCNQHLLGEHHELHCIYNIITKDKKGFARHPEVMRWRGKLSALILRHKKQVIEMTKRYMNHQSPILFVHNDCPVQDTFWQSPEKQRELLRARCENCKV